MRCTEINTLNYGRYDVPENLRRLVELNEWLYKEQLLPYGDLLGLYFSLDAKSMRYHNTPLDVIPFARTGADGVHFGFLTDFGQVTTLEEAYIVRVAPMDFDAPVKMVARNFEQFVALLLQYRAAIEMLDTTSEEWAYTQYEAVTTELMPNEQVVITALREHFLPMALPPLRSYFQQLGEEWAKDGG